MATPSSSSTSSSNAAHRLAPVSSHNPTLKVMKLSQPRFFSSPTAFFSATPSSTGEGGGAGSLVTAANSILFFASPQTYRGNAIVLPTVFEQVYVGQELRCFARASDLPKGSSMSATLERAGREPLHLGTSTSSSNREGIVELVITCRFGSPGVHELVVRCVSASNREVLKKVYRLDAAIAVNCAVEREGDRLQFLIDNVSKDLILNFASSFGGGEMSRRRGSPAATEREETMKLLQMCCDAEEENAEEDYLVLPGESKYFLLSLPALDTRSSPPLTDQPSRSRGTLPETEDPQPVSTSFVLRWVSQFGERGEIKIRLPLVSSSGSAPSDPPLKFKLGQPEFIPARYRESIDKCSLVMYASDVENIDIATKSHSFSGRKAATATAAATTTTDSGDVPQDREMLYVVPIKVGLEGDVFVSKV